jgi:hypothetical protein
MHYQKKRMGVLGLIAALSIGGCGDSSGVSTGTLSISLMDRPVDGVTELWVTIDEVWIKPQGGGPAFELPMTSAPMTVDLLSLTEQNAAVLVDEAVVDAGSYNWIEFKIDDSDATKAYAVTMIGEHMNVDVDVPADRIRLVSGFDVGPNQAVRFLFDWEVDTGLTEAVGRGLYILKPTFRILDVNEYGSVSGKLTSGTAMSVEACNANMMPKVVYFFSGEVMLDEWDGLDPQPVTTVDAVYDTGTGDYPYQALLMPNDVGYTIGLTCNADEAIPDFLAPLSDESLINVAGEPPLTGIDF